MRRYSIFDYPDRRKAYAGLKIMLSMVMFLVAAYLASRFSAVVLGLDPYPLPVWFVFAISLIVPVFTTCNIGGA